MSSTAGRIFLSYRRGDRHFAGRLADSLVGRFGRSRVFMDVDTIEPGVDFVAAIDDAVSSCDVLIAVIGRNWLGLTDSNGRRKLDSPNDFVTLEIRTALDRGIRVIPVLIDDAEMPAEDDLPETLRRLSRRHAVDVEHNTFHADLNRILVSVDRALQAAARDNVTDNRRETEAPAATTVAPASNEVRDTGARQVPRSTDPVRQPAPATTEYTDEPTVALPHVPPLGRGNYPLQPPTRRAASERALPLLRVAVRIALWWVIFTLSIVALFGLLSTIVNPSANDILGAVFGEAFLLALIAGTARFLRREISSQRLLLERPGLDPGAIIAAQRALTRRHLQRVALVCIGVSVFLSIALVFVPTNTPNGNTTTTPVIPQG